MEYEDKFMTMKAENDALQSKNMLGMASGNQNSFLTNPSVLIPNQSFLNTSAQQLKEKNPINMDSGGSGA
jgi:hypothetical protein